MRDLALGGWPQRLRRSELLWTHGDNAEFLAVVQHGLLKSVRPSAYGRATPHGVIGPWQCAGAIRVLLERPRAESVLACEHGAEVVCITRTALLAATRVSPALAATLAHAAYDEMDRKYFKIDLLVRRDAASRLAALMLRLFENHGRHSTPPSIPLLLSRRELAQCIGKSRREVTSVMASWKQAGVLRETGFGFEILDFDALREAAERGSSIHGR